MAKKKIKNQYNKAHAVILGAALVIMTIISASLVVGAAKARYSCSDTDGGIIPSKLGTTSGYFKSRVFSHTDYCADASNLKEYYCSGTTEMSAKISCGNDTYGAAYCLGNSIYKDYTDNFCSLGLCRNKKSSEFQEDCAGKSGYISGNYCINGAVYRDYRDYYCNAGACTHITRAELQQQCQTGCTNGICSYINLTGY
jgi:hypothetical protein